MTKLTTLSFVLLACVASLSCQSYSTGMQQSVARGDEVAAVSTMKSIAMAEQTYAISNSGKYGTLQQLVESGYLDSRFKSDSSPVKGYVLTVAVKPASGIEPDFFSCNADPTGAGETKGRHLYLDSASPEVKVNATQPATATDQRYSQ